MLDIQWIMVKSSIVDKSMFETDILDTRGELLPIAERPECARDCIEWLTQAREMVNRARESIDMSANSNLQNVCLDISRSIGILYPIV